MEAAIENITSLAINQLMECKATVVVIAKVVFAKEPKWTMAMAKNMR
jgi:hypothetical protein